jgi:hypothetical protein
MLSRCQKEWGMASVESGKLEEESDRPKRVCEAVRLL